MSKRARSLPALIAVIAVLEFFVFRNEFRLFRATAPSDTSMNLTLWVLFIVLQAVLAVSFARFFNEMSLWVAGLAGAATGAVTAGAAALLDKANERLAIIPLGWGTVAVVIVGVIVWFKYEHQS